MKQDLAQQVAAHLWKADRALHEAYCAIDQSDEAESLHAMKLAIATMMSSIYQGVTRKIYQEHPALAPEGLEP